MSPDWYGGYGLDRFTPAFKYTALALVLEYQGIPGGATPVTTAAPPGAAHNEVE